MNLKKTAIITAAALVLVFVALRIYGAFQRERDVALEQATAADQKAQELEEQSAKLKSQSDCNQLWMKYQNASLEKQIADLEGRSAPTPVEPSCSGYSPRLDEALDLVSKQFEVNMEAIEVKEFARYEREYAASRKYQSRYLMIRLWAFLTGTNPRTKPVEMVAEIDKSTQLDGCLKHAKNDADRKTCDEMFGEAQKQSAGR